MEPSGVLRGPNMGSSGVLDLPFWVLFGTLYGEVMGFRPLKDLQDP